MMICLILLHDIVVADLDSHKCRVVNLNDDQQPPYMAVLRNMWFIFLILGVRSLEGKPLVAVRLTGSDEH